MIEFLTPFAISRLAILNSAPPGHEFYGNQWTSSSGKWSEERVNDAIKSGIGYDPDEYDYTKGEDIESPISITNTDYDPSRDNIVQDDWNKYSEDKKVTIDNLTTEQEYVSPGRVAQYLNGKVKGSDPVYIQRYKGEDIIQDGNHRVVAAWLARKKEITVKYIDRDKLEKSGVKFQPWKDE